MSLFNLFAQTYPYINYNPINDSLKFSILKRAVEFSDKIKSYVVINSKQPKDHTKMEICLLNIQLLYLLRNEFGLTKSTSDFEEILKIINGNKNRDFNFLNNKEVSRYIDYSQKDLMQYKEKINVTSLIDKLIIKQKEGEVLRKNETKEKIGLDKYYDAVLSYEPFNFEYNNLKEKKMFCHIMFNYGLIFKTQHKTGQLKLVNIIPQSIYNTFYERFGKDWEPNFDN